LGKEGAAMSLMRYKITVEDDSQFDGLLRILRDHQTQICLQSRRSHFVAIEDPTAKALRELDKIGARVIEDPVYETER
jgi:hypothetical protein